MAIWDVKGKEMHQPLSELFGGRLRERLPCAAVGLYFRDLPESELVPALVAEAREYTRMGYRAVKLQIGRNLAYDTTLARAVREELPKTPLFAEAHHAYDLPEAIAVGRVLTEAGFAGFSEPLSPELPEQVARLAQATGVPIGDGSNEQTRWGFSALLSHGGVGMAQPDISWCGGPSEMVRIGAVAGSLGVNVVPRARGTQLNLAVALHYLAADFRLPGRVGTGTVFLERDGIPDPLRDMLFTQAVEIEDGMATVPVAPGLGVTIDTGCLREFCVGLTETTTS
jgi:D-galactarolactone cycloisomerase